MQKAPPSAGSSLHGVANARGESLVHSGPKCLQCRRPIPRPRKGQKACSATCRWQLWAAARRAEQEAHAADEEADRAALLLMRAQLDDLLARSDARRRRAMKQGDA
jgi:hypothetical protein